jgi:hypothetical protein
MAANSAAGSAADYSGLEIEGDRRRSNSGASPHGFSFIVGVAFSLNYIMGTGFLTLPWAFSKTGYVLLVW